MTTTLSEDAVWAGVRDVRTQIADLLAPLTPEQWDAQSLCAEWRVRDVVAHLILNATQPHEYTRERPQVADLQAVSVWLSQSARAVGSAWTQAELLEALRDCAPSQTLPPHLPPIRMLFDVVVHASDIRRPLALPPPAIPEQCLVAAAEVAATEERYGGPRRIAGLRLESTDVKWSVGSGAEVRGPLEALTMVMTGRSAGLDQQLEGEGVSTLAQRI